MEFDLIHWWGAFTWWLAMAGTSDPYVKFKMGNKVIHKSKTIYRDLNPTWDEDFDVTVDDLGTPLQVRVFDYDWGLQDDFLGSALLDLNRLDVNKWLNPIHFIHLSLFNRFNLRQVESCHLGALFGRMRRSSGLHRPGSNALCEMRRRSRRQRNSIIRYYSIRLLIVLDHRKIRHRKSTNRRASWRFRFGVRWSTSSSSKASDWSTRRAILYPNPICA